MVTMTEKFTSMPTVEKKRKWKKYKFTVICLDAYLCHI